MRNGIRVVTGLIVGLLVVAGLLIFVAPRLFSNEALQARLEARLSAALGRPVSIGTATVRLVPQPSVRVSDVKVGASQSGDRTSGEISTLVLIAAWRPLLERRLEIHRAEFDRPILELYPVESVASPERSTSQAEVAADQSVDIQVDELIIREGVIRKFDETGNPTFALEGWNESLSVEVTREGRLHFRGRTEIAAWKAALDTGTLGRGLPIRWQKTMTYESASDELEIAESDFLLGNLPVALTGTVSSAASDDPKLDLHFSGGPASVEGILGVIPEELLPPLEGITSTGTVSLSGHVNGSTLPGGQSDYELVIEIENGQIRHPAIADPIEEVLASLRLSPDQLQVVRLSAESGMNLIQATGVVTQLENDPILDLALDAEVALEWLTAFQTPEEGAPELSGRVQTELVVRGPARRTDELTVLGLVDLANVAMRGPKLDPPLTELSGRVEIEDRTLRTRDLRFKLGRSDASVSGTIGNYFAFLDEPAKDHESPARSAVPIDESSVDLTLHCDLLDIDDLSGESSAPSSEEEESAVFTFLEKMRGPFRLTADEMIVRGVVTEDAAGTARLDRGLIEIEHMTLKAFGGGVGLQGTVNVREPGKPEFDLQTQASAVNVARLLRESVPLGTLTGMTGLLEGTLDGTADFDGQLDEAFVLQLPSLTSIGNVKLVQGKLDGHPAQVALASFLDLPELRAVEFSDWLQPFEIRDGRLHFEGLSVKAGEFELQADGWQSIDGRVEFVASVLLPQEASAGLRAKLPRDVVPILFDGSGTRVMVPLKVSGPTTGPKVVLDRERVSASARRLAEERIAAERRALEERLELEKEKARRELEEQVKDRVREQTGGLLDDLLGSPADSSAADSSSAESDVEEELKGILNGLFKKK